MRYELLITVFLFFTVDAYSESKEEYSPERQKSYFDACRVSTMDMLGRIATNFENRKEELDLWSIDRCSTLRIINNIKDTDYGVWHKMIDPKYQGCLDGVDVTLGIIGDHDNSGGIDNETRNKFKAALCKMKIPKNHSISRVSR